MSVAAADFMVDLIIKHPQVAPLTGLLILASYHLKYGVIAKLQTDLSNLSSKIDGMSVITYRLAKKDPETDADAVRDVLWDNGRSFPDDFDSEGRYVGTEQNRHDPHYDKERWDDDRRPSEADD